MRNMFQDDMCTSTKIPIIVKKLYTVDNLINSDMSTYYRH